MKNRFILIRCEGEYEGYSCEGFFETVHEAKQCIKDWGYDIEKCELYELKSDNNFLKEAKNAIL